jgi:predicted alpha/beta-fold hydrolase
MDLYTYIQYFILGGSVTILVNYLVENYKHGPALSAYLYCAPTIYLLIIYMIYKDRGLKGYYTFIVHSLINYVANSVVILFLILLTKYIPGKMFETSFIVSILFTLYSIYYFLNIYKLEFTPRHL